MPRAPRSFAAAPAPEAPPEGYFLTYVVSAPVAGYARRIALDAGDAVSPGMPLVALEPARAEVLDARSRAAAEGDLLLF